MAMHGKGMALVGAGVFVALVAYGLLRPERVEPLPVLGVVPDFQLIDSRDRPFRLADLRGQVWVADFIFTTCPSFCPRLTRQMAGLQATTRDMADVALVSFSVDPENDRPDKLRAYATTHGLDTQRWHFATGERAAMYELIRDGFRLAVNERTEEEARDGEGIILHSDRFVLVDRRSRIRGYYHGTDDDSVAQLARDLRELAESDGEF